MLKLNNDKTVMMQFFTINKSVLIKNEGKSLVNSTKTKFLGLHIDQKLTFSLHIQNLLPQLSSSCFLLKNLRNTVSIDVIKKAYFEIFQSKLSYGIIFWGQSTEILKIFIKQKKQYEISLILASAHHANLIL